MKILHVISTMHPRAGGPCEGIRSLAPQLCSLGNSVEVVCLDDPGSEYLAGESFRIHAVGNGSGSWRYHSALSPWLKANLSRFNAVIMHGLWQYPGYALSRFAGQPCVPSYFLYAHGMLDPWFQSARERRFKAVRNWFYWKLIEHKIVRNAEAIFFTCAEEMRLAQQTFRPYHPKREVVVGFGVSQPPPYHQRMTDAFVKKCPGAKDRPYLLFLSRIDPKKGVDLLIQAYAKVYAANLTGQAPSVGLVIAGPGIETSYGQKMLALAVKTCPDQSVFFPGMLTGEAKWGAFYGAEAAALISHQENFGIAVAESLACGTPVLISDQINICREVEEDGAGFVGSDTEAGAEKLFRQWLAISVEDRARMKRAARFCYESRFGISRAATCLINAIEELTPLAVSIV